MRPKADQVNEYRSALRRWLDAIDAKREHYVINRFWEALCVAARAIDVTPGVEV